MNNSVRIVRKEVLSDNWYILTKVTFEYTRKDGTLETQVREVYDRGNGSAILLYNRQKKTVIVTQQFRLPTYLNGNESGMMIEVCAGLLDEDNPEECIRRETEEETGYKVRDVTKVMQVYTSPGSVTEILHLFTAEYSSDMKVSEGGGIEQENIEVIEIPFDDAYAMISEGKINDAKTILLLQYAKLHGLVN